MNRLLFVCGISVSALTLLEAGESLAFRVPAMWEYSAPLISPEVREVEPSHAQKDPTVVYHEGKWHVFMTVKLPDRSAIEHCSFKEWTEANVSKRTILPVSESDYYCAPQVFFFEPHRLWYLIYQMSVPGSKMMWVAYSTTADIDDPQSWTQGKPLPGLDGGPEDPRTVGGLDYWIICDDSRAYLFFTSLNGKMWRLSTTLEEFPSGFDGCEVALEAEVFEASHTYRIKGVNQYVMLIEQDGQRYFKAFVADRLDGEWKPLAATPESPFASHRNVRPAPGVEAWTDNISHGELVRDGIDQRLVIDPTNLRFVFQGLLEKDKKGQKYGALEWRIGMLSEGK